MGRRKRSSSSSTLLSIGNCKVEIEGSDFLSESTADCLVISVPNKGKVKISVNASARYPTRKSCNERLLSFTSEGNGGRSSHLEDHSFLLLNAKDIDSSSKLLLQEVLKLYMKELPTMNYAANTGKESLFLERCVSSGKYRTLLLVSNATEGSREVIAAVSYQIIPTDTQYAEIPIAAVCSNLQNKGIGRYLYEELRKRLQGVGVLTIFCWGDKESEGFWLKQGFISVAEVDTKGRARKLPLKADIRRALCFPGGSTLMVSHLKKDTSIPINPAKRINLLLKALPVPASPVPAKNHLETREDCVSIQTDQDVLKSINEQIEYPQPEALVKGGHSMMNKEKHDGSFIIGQLRDYRDSNLGNNVDLNRTHVDSGLEENERGTDGIHCSCSAQGVKKRVWKASLSSLKSKKVKGGYDIDCNLESNWNLIHENSERNDADLDDYSSLKSKNSSLFISPNVELRLGESASHAEDNRQAEFKSSDGFPLSGKPVVMLMNIADETKKACLTKENSFSGTHAGILVRYLKRNNRTTKSYLAKITCEGTCFSGYAMLTDSIVQDLGGAVTSHGSAATHVITGQARRTLNFCVSLCSGAWIVSSNWLKESFKQGSFVGELPFILKDDEYMLKYKSELRDAVLKARATPGALLKGYDVCITKHVRPPIGVLSTVVKSAGGNVLNGLDKMQDPSRTIFVACEENMDVALAAAKRGVRTYSSDWFMSCVMRQELDFEGPQFAESL